MSGDISEHESAWNFTNYEFDEYHQLLILLDQLSVAVEMRDNSKIEAYYSVLRTFYRRLRPVLYDAVKEEMDKELSALNDLKTRFVLQYQRNQDLPFQNVLTDRLGTFHDRLMELRQKLGLAFHTSRKLDKETELDRAMIPSFGRHKKVNISDQQ